MLNVLQRCFGQQLHGSWMAKLKLMIPSYGVSLADDAALCDRVRAETADALHIHYSENKTGSVSPVNVEH